MSANICGFLVLFVISIGTVFVIYALIRKSLCALLDEVVKLPSGTTFYRRLFLSALIFITLSPVLNTTFNLSRDAAFMEYVWKIANSLSSVFRNICLLIVVYLIIMTILLAVLRNRHD